MNNESFRKYSILYIAVFGIFFIQVLPRIFQDGMFMDGLLYASIAKQLANGIGSFWHLHLTDSLASQFYGHLPLAIYMESLIFRVFGNSIYVERLYSLFVILISAGVIIVIWKNITRSYSIGWLPLLFFFIIPRVIWTTENNMLENTVLLFSCISVLLLLLSINKIRLLYIFLAGITIALGFLSKGIVSLFPLSFSSGYYYFKKNIHLLDYLLTPLF